MRRVVVAVVLLALSWPASSAADHVGITASVSASLKERVGNSWRVEVQWTGTCTGASGSLSWYGSLSLIESNTGKSTYLGGVSSGSGTDAPLIAMKRQERFFHPHLRLACGEDSTRHGSQFVETDGNTVTIPALGTGGGGGSGGGGGGGGGGGESGDGGPTDPLGSGGCLNIIQGLPGPDRIDGTDVGDLIDGAGGADVIRGRAGHDCLIGSRGGDRLLGQGGRDRLTGGGGRDTLDGGGGRNAYDAGPGRDLVRAANGRRETVRCGGGRDRARVDESDVTRACEQVDRV